MNREDIIRMAREAGMEFRENADEFNTAYCDGVHRDELERFAALVAAAERKAMMQLFTDPENQPTQHGTVTFEYMQREIAAEREACAKACEDYWQIDGTDTALAFAASVRARGQA